MKIINMKTVKYLMTAAVIAAMASCAPQPYTEEDIFISSEDQLTKELEAENPEGYDFYNLHDFMDQFMTERGDSCWTYRTRSEVVDGGKKYYLFSIDTIRSGGRGIYIRGRITTDDYGGNYYKSMVIQQIIEGKQQNLRLSVDIGSASGLYQLGQEIIIRCNGLAIGRYANQPQLCVPSYNNNVNAQNASQKIGWAPGRIPNEIFRRVTKLVGTPNTSLLKYDTINITDFFGERDLVKVRKMDGKLVRMLNIHFTGQYENNGALVPCNHYVMGQTSDSLGLPEIDPYADVFGPTTNNIGYPQSRVIMDEDGKTTLVSTSEYAKYAYYLLPESKYVGTITGILGFYADNNRYATQSSMDGYEWAITPRDILKIKDIQLQDAEGNSWIPQEFITNLLDNEEKQED